MRKLNIILFSLIMLLAAGLLGACGNDLDLTDEEVERIVNYSANLLEKYNANKRGTLADVSDTSLAILLEEEDLQAAEEAARAARRELRKQQEAAGENAEDGDAGSDGSVNNNPLIDTNATEFTSIAGLLGIEGFSIDYTGYDVVDSYPESEADNDFMFGINSGAGDSLLVLKFNVRNNGSEPAHCSVLDKNPAFKLKINGDRHSFLKTLLMDDLATFDEDMEGGESMEAVLIAEISEAKAASINTLVLTLRNENGDNQMVLQGSGGQAAAPDVPSETAEPGADTPEASDGAGASEDGNVDSIDASDLASFNEEFGDVLDGSANEN